MRRFRYRSEPYKGEVNIVAASSLRKRMRAARRGMLPPEVIRQIKDAQSEEALMRHPWYRKKKSWDWLRAIPAMDAA